MCMCRCQDYVEIDTGAGGRSEFCGSSYPKEPLLVGTGTCDTLDFN